MTESTDGRTRIAITVAVSGALLLAVLAWGLVDLHDTNASILAAVSKPDVPAWTQTFFTEYTATDGKSYHVSVTSEPGESPIATALRFEQAIKELQHSYPERR